MNAKPGDLAVVKGLIDCANLNGMLVDVLCYVQPHEELTDPEGGVHINDAVIGLLAKSCGSPFYAVGMGLSYGLFYPRNLHPIRDQPGDDESLTWAGLPADYGVTA
jgi:hypothetical protein